ncbi:hypothetical protein [Nostoc sp.]|uniref:hypothetical protein n=1 Tax=Nostoc sp. TaxID=1180 RepID=UPI002FFA7025
MIRQSTAKASLPVEILASRYFIDWLQSQQISLAFSTYQSSRLMLLGVNAHLILLCGRFMLLGTHHKQ